MEKYKKEIFIIIGVSIMVALIFTFAIGDGILYGEYANKKCIDLGNNYGKVQNSGWFSKEIRLSCRKINSNGEVIHSYPYVLKEVR